MKALKYLLFTVAGLAVLVAGGVAIFAMTFDPNQYRGQIESAVKDRTGRTLKLQGPLQLAFYPSLGGKVAGVSLSEKGSDKEFLSLDGARASVALLPLLHGEVIVDKVHVEGLKAQVVKDKGGHYNFDDLLQAKEAKESAKKEEPKAEPGGKQAVKFDVAGVTIERSSVAYRDLGTGRELSLSDLRLATGRIAEKADGRLELHAAVKGKEPAMDAIVELAGDYRFDLAAKAFELSKLDARVSGAAAGLRDLKLVLKGDVAADPTKSEYRVKGLALDVSGAQDKNRLEAKVAAPEILVSKDQAKGGAITAEFRLKGDGRSTEAALKLSGVQGSAKALVVPSISGEVAMAAPDLPNKGFKVPLNGSLRADLEKQTANAELTSKFDESNIQAKLGLAKFSPPAYTFDVNVDRLNVDKYFPPKDAAAQPAAKGGEAKPAAKPEADTPVDLSALKGLTATGRLQFGALQVHNLKLANLKSEVRAANGRADIGPHSANLYDGSLAGAITLNANGNHIAVKENLTNISVGPLLRDAAKRDALEGRGNVSLDVTGAGATVNAIKKSLNGAAKLNLKDGAIKGFDIGAILQKVKSLGGGKSAQGANTRESTAFSELSASFAIKNGVAHNEDLDMKAPLFRLGGRGDIDIGNSQLDYLAKASVVATTKGQGGADLSQLAGVTVPVKLTGPFDAVKYEVDYAAVAADVAKSKIGQKIGERLGLPKAGGDAGKPAAGGGGGSAVDKLRGLFGR